MRLSRGLLDCGVSVHLRVWDSLWHVFECYDEIPEARRSLEEIGHFLISAAD